MIAKLKCYRAGISEITTWSENSTIEVTSYKKKTFAGMDLSHYCPMVGGDNFGHLSWFDLILAAACLCNVSEVTVIFYTSKISIQNYGLCNFFSNSLERCYLSASLKKFVTASIVYSIKQFDCAFIFHTFYEMVFSHKILQKKLQHYFVNNCLVSERTVEPFQVLAPRTSTF